MDRDATCATVHVGPLPASMVGALMSELQKQLQTVLGLHCSIVYRMKLAIDARPVIKNGFLHCFL